MTIRVVIVDDQQLVRAGLRLILDAEDDFEVVAEAPDGQAALDACARHRVDVVLMDVRMPGMDGVTTTRRLLARASADAPAVVILTTYDLDEYVYDALRAGATGFMLKDAPPEQLVTAIREAERGDALLAPRVTRRLIERFAPRMPDARTRQALTSLSAREREVLELIGRGLSNAEIADMLILGEATVKTHASNLLRKLQLRDRAQAVVFAYESGVIQPGAGHPASDPKRLGE